MAKKNNEQFIDVNESTVELLLYSSTNWNKKSNGVQLLSAAGGKLGKPKHNFSVHLFGGIYR